jgi:ribosomal protein L11 methylase PrmA
MRDLMEKCDLKAILGPDLVGYHFEEDFAFLFCVAKMDLRALMALIPGLELREEHRLRYDEWQDGAGASPMFIGPLSVLPFEDRKGYPEELFLEGFSKNRDLCLSLGIPDGLFSATDLMGYPEPLPPVVIDPGLAFGYGGHPTTKACLSFLLRVMSPNNKNRPKSFLDLGSGTGVLSLAALRLGGEKAFGVDYSHLAAQNALFNLKLNKLEDKGNFVHGLAGDYAKEPAELLMANIPLAVHFELLEKGAYRGRKYLILSGLLPREADQLTEKLNLELELKELDNHRDDRWSSWLLEVMGEKG